MDNFTTAEGSVVSTAADAAHTTVDPPSTGGKVPIYVTFCDGSDKILVLMPNTSRVRDLQLEVLKRRGQLPSGDYLTDPVIRTTGPNISVVDGQDMLLELVPHTDNKTFSFGAPPTNGGMMGSGSQYDILPKRLEHLKLRHERKSTQDIRWICSEDALNAKKLDSIPIDEASFNPQMTLEDFYAAAVVRLGAELASLKLWSKYGPLYPTGNKTTMGDLGLSSLGETVDIFFQLHGPKDQHSLPSDIAALDFDPKTQLDIETTPRGFCTFMTCVKIFIHHMQKDSITLRTALHVLLRVTHFPPALLAFTGIYARGIMDISNRHNIQLLAQVFNSLCRAMVPDWVCSSIESKLEGCRQVMAWIYQLCIDIKPHKDKADKTPKHVHQMHIFQPNDGDVENLANSSLFGNAELVTISHDESVPEAKFAVDLETKVYGLGRKLALAASVHREMHEQYHYYFIPKCGWSNFIKSLRLPYPGMTEFDGLLTTANIYPTFRMVDPMKLGACLSSELPIVTLSGRGFVSVYDQEDIECSERGFHLWNVVEGRLETNANNPGQEISQGLEAIIEERKEAQSWEVDAWANWTPTANHGIPDESIVICVDTSSSMNQDMPSWWNTTSDVKGQKTSRLHEVKDFFSHFSTRLSSYGLSAHIGLIVFDSYAKILQPLTAIQLDFRHKLESADTSGRTAIYKALQTAGEMLIHHKQTFSETKCRVILLTDGMNNQPGDPLQVCMKLHDNGIVLDAIVIGTHATQDLFKIARSTGGYAFRPSSQELFFQIFLLETMVDIRTRPVIVREKPADWTGRLWRQWDPKPADMEDRYSFPACKPHPCETDSFMSVDDANRYLNKKRSSTGSIAFSSSGFSDSYSTLSGRQSTYSSIPFTTGFLMGEVKQMIGNPHQDIDVYVSQQNMGFWKVVIEGPKASAYEDGTFLLFVDIGPEFPRLPPAVRFITPVLHPNISKHGRICHPIFDREWDPNMHVFQVLQQIYGIFMSLEARDAIDPIASLKFYTDADAGRKQVKEYVEHFATARTRADYREEIIGNGPAHGPSSGSGLTIRVHDGDSVASDTTIRPTDQGLLRRAIFGSSTPSLGRHSARPPPFMVGGNSGQLTLSSLATIDEADNSASTPEEDGAFGERRVRARRDYAR